MELNLSKQALPATELVYEGSMEQPIESDVLLPDYCPDIVKVLRCFVDTSVTGTAASAGRVTVDINCMLKIFYLGDDKTVRSIEQKLPYSKSADISREMSEPVVLTNTKSDYVNCRAINQRRLEVRAAVSIGCRILSRTTREVLRAAEGGGIQLRSEPVSGVEITGDYIHRFSQHEDLQLPPQKPAVRSIIMCGCVVRPGESKVVYGKVILKGELRISVLYQPDDENICPEKMEYSLPLSHIADVEGVTEDSICDVEITAESCEISPKVDSDGECRMLAMDCMLRVRVIAHRQVSEEIVTDCYCTECGCIQERIPLGVLSILKPVDEWCQSKGEIKSPGEGGRVCDVFCRVSGVTYEKKENSIMVKTALVICLFECTADGSAGYREEVGECVTEIPCTHMGSMLFALRAHPVSCDFSINSSGDVDYRCEVHLFGCIYSLVETEAISGAAADEETAVPAISDASLIVYYAQEGERVWDIAKRYNTSVFQIMGTNDLDGQTITDRRMLLVPIV